MRCDKLGFGKRIAAIILLLAIMATVCAVAFAAQSYPFFTVTTDSVKMRKNASTSAVVVKNLEAGTLVEVTGASGNFYAVTVDGKSGYVMKKYINMDKESIVTPTPVPVETVSGYPYSTKTLDQVNLREKKNTTSAILKVIPKNAEITVKSVSGSYAEVTYQGKNGWVKKEFIMVKKVVKPTPTPTAVPTLSPEEDAGGYTVLQKGMNGPEVKALQQALIELGFLNGSADGQFGSATEYAVINFQEMNSYPATGIMDANIQAFLYVGKPKNSKGTAAKINTLAPVEGVSIRLNNTGDKVGQVQTRLADMGYYTGAINCVYDSKTKAAVTAFQKKNGLTADGVCGAATQKAIFDGTGMKANETPTPTVAPTATPAPTFAVPGETVRLNSAGNDAKMVQKRLKELKYYKGAVDGKFGKASVTALQKFQEANGLQADGVAGKATYEVLFSWNALAAGQTPAPTAEPEATPFVTMAPTPRSYETLKKGSKGEGVKNLQKELITLGYLTGTADGNFGTQTEKAVTAFQKNNGLKADGKAGTGTLTKLYSGSAKKNTQAAKEEGTAAVTIPTTLKKGDSNDAVKAMQQKLISLGYLSGKADGKFGVMTYQALQAFQKANNLSVDGVAGAKTLSKLDGNAVAASSTASKTPATKTNTTSTTTGGYSASSVIYANWYTTVKAIAKKYPYVTLYDPATGISWQEHIFSLGAHADSEPLTANDTAKMEKVFGGNTWNAKSVWVIFADGSIYLASTHSMPHEVQHITDNNFAGHKCIHFPRTEAEVTRIGPYATSHQKCIDEAWAKIQSMK